MKLYRVPEGGALFCGACLGDGQRVAAVELDPALFPGTWSLLRCSDCGAAAPGETAPVAPVAGTIAVDALPADGAPLSLESDDEGV